MGVNLIKRLLNLGANVRATLFKKDAIIKDSRIKYLRGDLRLAEFCQEVVDGVDYVFMCAANTSGAKVMATNPLFHFILKRSSEIHEFR